MTDKEKKIRAIKRIINMQNQINKLSKSNKKYTLYELETESMQKINTIQARLLPLYRNYTDFNFKK